MKALRMPALASVAFVAFLFPAFGCSKIAGWAIDKAIGDDAGIAESALSGGSSTSASAMKVCHLVTDAEIQSITGYKIVTKTEDASAHSCIWRVTPTGKEDPSAPSAGGTINLSVFSETVALVVPILGEQKDIPGLGNKAAWVGAPSPTLRIHVNGGNVINILVSDPQKALSHVFEKKATPTAGLEYPEVEKEAIAIGKAAVGRY